MVNDRGETRRSPLHGDHEVCEVGDLIERSASLHPETRDRCRDEQIEALGLDELD